MQGPLLPPAVSWRASWFRSLQEDISKNHCRVKWDLVRKCIGLFAALSELFGWNGPSVPVLIPAEGIMASRCVRDVGRHNPCYVGDLLQDDAETQSSIFSQKMLLCCSRPVMFEAVKKQCSVHNVLLGTVRISWNLSFVLNSSAPFLCHTLTTWQ